MGVEIHKTDESGPEQLGRTRGVGEESSQSKCNAEKEVDEGDELEYQETSSILLDKSSQTTVEAFENAQDAILVRNSGVFVSDYDGDLFALAFAELFPYGRGHPGIIRTVPVSLEECISYYFRLSSRKFAQH